MTAESSPSVTFTEEYVSSSEGYEDTHFGYSCDACGAFIKSSWHTERHVEWHASLTPQSGHFGSEADRA